MSEFEKVCRYQKAQTLPLIELQQRLLKLQGLMEMLLAGSTCKAQATPAEAEAETQAADNGGGRT